MLNPVLDQHVAAQEEQDADDAEPCEEDRPAVARSDLPIMTTGAVLRGCATVALAALATGHLAMFVRLASLAAAIGVGRHSAFQEAMASLHDRIRALGARRAGAHHQRTWHRLCSLLGSIGAPPPPLLARQWSGSDDEPGHRQAFGSPAPPARLEATVQAQCRLIRRIDAARHVLQTATSLQYRLGAACPSVARVEDAAVSRRGPEDGPAGAAAAPSGRAEHVSLPALRRILRDILRDQQCALQSVIALENGAKDALGGLVTEREAPPAPRVVTLSWIRSARNELAASLSEFVAQSFIPLPPASCRQRWERRYEFLLDMTMTHLAHLDGALSGRRSCDGDCDNGDAATPARQSLPSKCRALQAILSQLVTETFDSYSVEGMEHWKLVIDLLEDMTASARTAAVTSCKARPRPDGSMRNVAADQAAAPGHAVAAKAEPEEYVAENLPASQESLPDSTESAASTIQTIVYVGKGTVVPRSFVAQHQPNLSEGSPISLNPLTMESLLSELSQYLQTLPKAQEVELTEEQHGSGNSSGCIAAETDLDDESDVSAVSASLANSRADLFIGELSQTLSRLGVSDEHYDSRQLSK